MGRLLEDRGNPDEALLCFQEASSTDTSSAEALCCRAGNLQRRGDFDVAAFYFEGVSFVLLTSRVGCACKYLIDSGVFLGSKAQVSSLRRNYVYAVIGDILLSPVYFASKQHLVVSVWRGIS